VDDQRPNVAQIEDWDGPLGQRWVADAERLDRMSRGFGEQIVERLAPQRGERILDIGCGSGALALTIGAITGPDGSVTGLDISGPMLELARRRAGRTGVANVRFEQGDAQLHPLPLAAFDAAVSRFGVMFFDDPVAAFANVGRALKPGGRMIFTCWQDLLRNDWIMVPASAALLHVPMPDLGEPGGPGPFSFADPERLRHVLDAAAFSNIVVEEVVRPVRLGDSVDDALGYIQHSEIADALMQGVDTQTATRAWTAVRETLKAYASAKGVEFNGAALLVTANRAG
jgi:SAM-dependent methyltransferase